MLAHTVSGVCGRPCPPSISPTGLPRYGIGGAEAGLTIFHRGSNGCQLSASGARAKRHGRNFEVWGPSGERSRSEPVPTASNS
eukprot:scaffold10761_cov62-Phaeocystis_antarctica.AAC.7